MERKARALARLNEGRQALRQALDGIDPEDAFLGSRWSVWEVLKHLDAENFVDALEKISTGEMEMLPPFSSRADHLRKDIEHLEATYDRLKQVIEGLTEEQLALPVTPPHPEHSFPGLTRLELVERSSGHAGTHARQVELTRKYVAEFNARDKTVTVLALGSGEDNAVSQKIQELVAFADYTAGDAAALQMVRPWIRGLEAEFRPGNTAEIVSRMAREARAGLWAVICVRSSDPDQDHPVLMDLARQYCDKVVIVT